MQGSTREDKTRRRPTPVVAQAQGRPLVEAFKRYFRLISDDAAGLAFHCESCDETIHVPAKRRADVGYVVELLNHAHKNHRHRR